MKHVEELVSLGHGIGGTTDVRKLFEESRKRMQAIHEQSDAVYITTPELAKKLGLDGEW